MLSALTDGEYYMHTHLSRIFPHQFAILAKVLVHRKALSEQRTADIPDGSGNLQALTRRCPLCRKPGAVF